VQEELLDGKYDYKSVKQDLASVVVQERLDVQEIAIKKQRKLVEDGNTTANGKNVGREDGQEDTQQQLHPLFARKYVLATQLNLLLSVNNKLQSSMEPVTLQLQLHPEPFQFFPALLEQVTLTNADPLLKDIAQNNAETKINLQLQAKVHGVYLNHLEHVSEQMLKLNA